MVKSTMTETCSAVLKSRRNYSSDGAERTDDGRAFHARAVVTGKARSPSVVRRLDGMTSVDLEALRRRRREPTSAVTWRVSARYDGAVWTIWPASFGRSETWRQGRNWDLFSEGGYLGDETASLIGPIPKQPYNYGLAWRRFFILTIWANLPRSRV